MDYLSTGRVEKIKEKIKEFKDNDNYVSKIIYTELPDKLDIISKLKLLNISRKELKKQFNEITKLRNKVAHASDYADTRENCNNTSITINFILMLLEQISNFEI